MYWIEVEAVFSAAHALRLGEGTAEPLHGHDFRATVRLEADSLDGIETVMDFHLLQAMLQKVIGPWRNRNLNEIAPFEKKGGAVNPSAERIAETIGRRIEQELRGTGAVRVAEVRVTEAAGCVAGWRSGQ